MNARGMALAAVARVAVYALLLGVGLEALVSAAAGGVDPDWLFGEDGFFDAHVTKGAYKLFAAPVLAAAALLAWRGRERLVGEVAAYASTGSAMLALAGALVVLVHAQVLGQKQLWNAVAEGPRARIAKKTLEEGSELTGYALIAFAALEALLSVRLATRSVGSSRERRPPPLRGDRRPRTPRRGHRSSSDC